MAVFLFEIIAILIFLRFADRSRMRELLPVVLTGIYVRYLEHFLLIDLFQLWEILGPPWRELWLPITADLTVWPVSVYLYIQYSSGRLQWLRTALYALVMLLYLKALMLFDVFTMGEHWNLYYSYAVLNGYYWLLYLVWKWLRQGLGGVRQHV